MKKESIRKIVKCLFAVYCIALIYILFLYGYRTGSLLPFRNPFKERFDRPNIVPFRTIFSYLERITTITRIAAINLFGNILMFVPMGMALPVLFEKKFNRLWKVAVFVIVLVIIVETTQFITVTGSADIDDLILNTVGAMIGYGMIKIRLFRKVLKLDE